MDIYAAIGKKVLARRKALGLNQEDVAQRVGFLRTSVANIEKGRQRVPLHTLAKVAAALDCAPGALLPASFLPTGDAQRVAELEEKLADVKAMLREIIEEL